MKRIYTFIFLSFTLASVQAQIAGTWTLAPKAQALGVGPGLGDFSWWSNTADDVDSRACFFDDKFIFNEDGTFQNVQDGVTWLEVWQGPAEDTCGDPVAPHDGSADATWAFNENDMTITITGVGAHLGLPKVINGAEITDPATAPASITYPISLSDDGMTMMIDINFGPGFWHYELAKSETTSTEDIVADVAIYPNPAADFLTIESTQKIDKLIIRSLSGNDVITMSNITETRRIDLSEFVSGIYLVETQTAGQRMTQKLVVR